MAWTDDTYPQFQQWNQDTENVQINQQPVSQPTTILQQLPVATSSPTPSTGPAHVKQDLVELMMIQNTQMHQVIMNNMTMSALSSFGYSQPQLHPPSTSEVQSFGYSQPQLHPPSTSEVQSFGYSQPQLHPPFTSEVQSFGYSQPQPHPPPLKRAVPPPPPPSATRTVGADVPPATDYYEAMERRQ
ncbi:proline-rich protein 29-like [Oncorhynchus masou masou]|uniref:proline-rich protein 29-like n=1 Tax=Oncorhynchus masou masou TaxID=90313 RepID=UPI003183B671